MPQPTRPATKADSAPIALLGILIPGPAPLPTRFYLVSMPISAASPKVIDVKGELVSDVRAA